MKTTASYKVLTVTHQLLEAEINSLSAKGWKVVGVTYYGQTDFVLAILEKI